jgi:hypothetical protein
MVALINWIKGNVRNYINYQLGQQSTVDIPKPNSLSAY